jgi:hypothetical protein
MNQRSFQALLAELFRNVGAVGARAAPGAGRCSCHGLDVAIYHDGRTDPHQVHAYVDCGSVPASRQREVFRNLLLQHLHLEPPHHTVVGLDGTSGNIVLVARIPFDAGLNGARLAVILQRLIRQVLIWRSSPPATRLPASRRRTLRHPS